MKNVRLLLKYFGPYKWSAVRIVLYNILSALFSLLTFALIKPFLTVLFRGGEVIADPGQFSLTPDNPDSFTEYYLTIVIQKNG
jgi:hypothetical protein